MHLKTSRAQMQNDVPQPENAPAATEPLTIKGLESRVPHLDLTKTEGSKWNMNCIFGGRVS